VRPAPQHPGVLSVALLQADFLHPIFTLLVAFLQADFLRSIFIALNDESCGVRALTIQLVSLFESKLRRERERERERE